MSIAQAAGFVAAGIVGRTIEQGIANTLGLGTLRHGTNIANWIGIRIFGTCPEYSDNGSAQTWQDGRQFFFHYANPVDTEAPSTYSTIKINPDKYTRFESRDLEFRSNLKLLNSKCVPSVLACPIAVALTIILPPVKVHLPDDLVKPRPEVLFDRDADFTRYRDRYYCYTTTKWISPLNMGVFGSLWNCFTPKTPIRMYDNMPRVLTGVIQLSLSVAVVKAAMKYAPMFVEANKASLIAGFVLGAI